tara:strand:- start:3501 stop:4076 length:576 start_codon:yes stop_codon:yes gene_type:complete
MIRIGILGDIGSGKSFVAQSFGYPVFDADMEVSKLYRSDKKTFNKLRKVIPEHISSYPVDKKEITGAILAKKSNLKKIVKIIHLEVRKKMHFFLKKNKNKKIVILDIPLLLENKINIKNDILIFVYANKSVVKTRLHKRSNFNEKLMTKFRDIQLPLDYKKKKSKFTINNNFSKKSVKNKVKNILRKILDK